MSKGYYVYINNEGYVTPSGSTSGWAERAAIYSSIEVANSVLRLMGVANDTSVRPYRTGYVCEANHCGTALRA